MGLAPSNQRTQASVFIEELYVKSLIDYKRFGMSLVSNKSGGVLTIGDYDKKFVGNKTITYNDLIN